MRLRISTALHHIVSAHAIRVAGVLLVLSIGIHAETPTIDRDLADAYVSTFLKDQGKIADEHLLFIALEFYPSNGDALYLLGKHPTISKTKAVEYLEKSLNADHWSVFTPNDAGVELFKSYVQMKRYSRAGVLLSGYELDFYHSPEDALLLATYYRTIGDDVRFTQVVEKGYSKWYRYFVPLKISADPDFRSLLLERIIQFGDFNPGIEALEALIPYVPEDELETLVRRYVNSGEFSPVLHAYAIKLGLIDIDELSFIASYGTSISKILHFGADDPLIEEYLDKIYAEFSGEVRFDANNDGFSEEMLKFENGMLILQTVDGDQDGIDDVVIQYGQTGSPTRIGVLDGEDDWDILYDQYPFVRTISRDNGIEVKYSFDLAPLSLVDVSAKPYIPSALTIPVSDMLSEYCIEKNVGFESRGVENSESGSEQLYSLDSNNDGIPEYTVSFKSGLKDEYWDIDEDGVMDIHQLQNNRTGMMDLTLFGYEIKMRNGKPESLSYEGVEKPLITEDSIVWIDTKPVDISAVELPSGYFSLDGRAYFGYKFNGYIFIQSVGN